MPKKILMVSVHRAGGELKGFPENSIQSLCYISSKIPRLIAYDIEKTLDSVMVFMLDKTLDRTSNRSGKVVENTLKKIKSLNLKDNFGNITPYKILA